MGNYPVSAHRRSGSFAQPLRCVRALGVAALFAAALYTIVERRPAARRLIVALVTLLILIELLPSPRALFSAEVPSIYRIIAADPREDAAVLELPFGVRDGTMSVRNSQSTRFPDRPREADPWRVPFARVSQRRLADTRRDAVLQALVNLSEGKPLSSDEAELMKVGWKDLLQRAASNRICRGRPRTCVAGSAIAHRHNTAPSSCGCPRSISFVSAGMRQGATRGVLVHVD